MSYNSVQVIEQVAGDNTQALDLSEQAHQLLTWMTTDFGRHIINLCTTHTFRGGTSVCIMHKMLYFYIVAVEKQTKKLYLFAFICMQVYYVSVSKCTCERLCSTCTHSCCIEEY